MTDSELVSKLRQGNAEAEEEFYHRYSPRLKAAATYFLGWQDPEIEDLVHDTFIIALGKLEVYDASRASLYTWMNHICVNLCYQRIRKRKRLALQLQEELEQLTGAIALQWHRDGEAAAEAEELQESRLKCLRKGFSALGTLCQTVLRLREYKGLSYAEIADALKVPMGTVARRLSRCRENLKMLVLDTKDIECKR